MTIETARRKIGLVCSHLGETINSILLKDMLAEKEIAVDYYPYLVDAITPFTSQEYPVIVSAFELAPGLRLPPEFQKIWDSSDNRRTRTAELGLHLIRKIWQSPVSGKAKIIVADLFRPSGDSIHRDVEARALRAGADKYIDLYCGRNQHAYDALVSEVAKGLE